MPAGMVPTAGRTDGGAPVTEHPIRTPNRTSESDSNERTNERTNGDVPYGRLSRTGSRRTDAYQGSEVSLGDIIKGGFLPTTERHPIIRIGAREPIPPHVRAAVLYRDHFQCRFCPSGTKLAGPWHLDHVIPWSAGGPDTTDNLRVLCETHNVDRSNFIDHMDHPMQPATWWCQRCYTEAHHWSYYIDGSVECPRHGIHPSCRVVGAYRRKAELGELQTWHKRSPIHQFTTVAYCAHCDLPGLTSVTL